MSGFIPIDRFMNELSLPMLAVEDGETWFECPTCQQEAAHIRQASDHPWLVYFCEACEQGGIGTELYAKATGMHYQLAKLEMKKLTGYITSGMKKRAKADERRLEDRLLVDLRFEHDDLSTNEFITTIVTKTFGIKERAAWDRWKRPGVRNPLVAGLRVRIEQREFSGAVRESRQEHSTDEPRGSLGHSPTREAFLPIDSHCTTNNVAVEEEERPPGPDPDPDSAREGGMSGVPDQTCTS